MLKKQNLSKSRNALEGSETAQPAQAPRFVSCPGCKKKIAAADWEAALGVCPRCGLHTHLPVRKRLSSVADEGSFQEWDAGLTSRDFLQFPGYGEKLASAREGSGEAEGVLTGRCTIGSLPCAIFIMNPDFMMGSMGTTVGEKITRCFERATEEGLPVVGFTASGGARMQEGTLSLMQMAKTSAAVKRHSDRGGLFLTVLTDPTSGGVTASFAMEGDILLSEPGALIAFAGPRVIEQTIHKKLPAGFQRAEFLLEHGFLDKIVPRNRLRSTLYRLLRFHVREEEDHV